MQKPDWNDLRIFLAVARTGQLARAGALLGVNGTTVARRVRRLESQLGGILFEQTREGQVLTEAGELLLLHVEAMAGAAGEIETVGGPVTSALTGTLRVSVAEGFGSWFLARHVPEFVAANPNLTLDLVANSGFLSVTKREADIAVMLSRPRTGALISGKLSDYTLQLFATREYLACRGIPRSSSDLADGHRFIGYIPDLIYAPELKYLDEVQPGLRPEIRSSSINAQYHLVASGSGIAVLPSFIGKVDPQLQVLLPDFQLARVRAGREWIVDMARRHRSALVAE
jgi:DNA-binding transcriptional LysR family regulator